MKNGSSLFLNFIKNISSKGLFGNEEEIESLCSRFLKRLEKISITTFVNKTSLSWFHHWFACFKIGISIRTVMKGDEYLNSMVFIRLQETQRLLIEYRILDRLCAYYSIFRQLRFMLESVLQAYYIDKEYPEVNLQGKLSILKQMKRDKKAIGKPLLEMTNLNSHVKQKINGLYKELSDAVHPDYKDYLPFTKAQTRKDVYFEWISRWALVPNPKLAQLCLQKLNQVMDIIYLLIFDTFGGNALIVFKDIKEVLSRAECNLSLKFIDSFTHREQPKRINIP